MVTRGRSIFDLVYSLSTKDNRLFFQEGRRILASMGHRRSNHRGMSSRRNMSNRSVVQIRRRNGRGTRYGRAYSCHAQRTRQTNRQALSVERLLPRSRVKGRLRRVYRRHAPRDSIRRRQANTVATMHSSRRNYRASSHTSSRAPMQHLLLANRQRRHQVVTHAKR